MDSDPLLLKNQLCFPVYAASRLIIREYQPYLDDLGITYPQYLAMMVLWEKEGLTVNEISRLLILNTNTVTPLLKRMEQQGLIIRKRSEEDERKVIVALTDKGRNMRRDAVRIPEGLASRVLDGPFEVKELSELKATMDKLITYLAENPRQEG